MKQFFILLGLSCFFSITAQEHQCAISKQRSYANQFSQMQKTSAQGPQIAHEMKYDVKFVHLNLNVERTTKYISGNVKTVANVSATVLDTFQTLLHLNLVLDSMRFNGALLTPIRQDSMVKVGIGTPLSNGTSFTATIFYHGTPPNGGSAIGSGFSNGTSPSWGNSATWSLSESFVAYHWWPCKQVLTDKIDSSWVFVTTDSVNKAGSNGILRNVVTVGNKKRFEWKSRYPIDYYLISVAVARYKEYKQYAKPQYLLNDSILIQNYVYDNAWNSSNWQNTQKVELDQMPQVLNFLSNMYGMYPFYKEKYGHCMAPLSGGMEHQTMTTVGYFDYYVDAHELGHQWWGDNVTCRSWGDIWLNEGFASYTEHLVAEYLDPINFFSNLVIAQNNVMTQPGGSVHFTNSDTLNTQRIFSSRLTYDKGGAIIHSLRFLTNNDSAWFNTLRGFQNLYKKSTASAINFQNYYQAQTGINPAIFFNQWYYGQGYPTFNVKFNSNGSNWFIQSTQAVSMPGTTPLFITPIEYKIHRSGKADTTIRVMHSTTIENYIIPMTGTITGITVDPNNWLINKENVSKDPSLGLGVSVNEFENIAPEFMIGPNPASSYVQIKNPSNVSGKADLMDISGRIISSTVLTQNVALSLDGLAPGIYFVKLQDKDGVELKTEKVIKE